MVDKNKPSADYIALIESLNPFYVFGFGSLMWNPEFDYEANFFGRVWDYHRRFGLWSFHYRGTRQLPGLVLGLDAGGSSVGICFRVREADKKLVGEKLWQREMVSYAYIPKIVMVAVEVDGVLCPVKALAFVLNSYHEQYVKPIMALEDKAKIIATAKGLSGPNSDYFLNTVATLKKMNIKDSYIDALAIAYHQLKK